MLMNEKLLPKNFFKNNPVDELSAANLAYFKITIGMGTDFDKLLSEGLNKVMGEKRRISSGNEKETISTLRCGEEIVAFMRTEFDIVNQHLLCKKALSMQADTIPLMLRRYRTTYQDVFVDTAVQILAHAEKCYAEMLLEMYAEIRNPYAQSMACLVFGVQHMEHAAPLLIKEHERMKREYTQVSLYQGPLVGLHILYGKR